LILFDREHVIGSLLENDFPCGQILGVPRIHYDQLALYILAIQQLLGGWDFITLVGDSNGPKPPSALHSEAADQLDSSGMTQHFAIDGDHPIDGRA
jgi:hypothetical protein